MVDKTDDVKDQELFKGMNPDDLPDEAKGFYKSMLADYTRKTQELAGQRKDWTQEKDGLIQKVQNLGALEQEVGQWREWYKSLEEQVGGEDKQTQLAKEQELREKLERGEPAANVQAIQKLEAQINTLQDKLIGYERTLGESGKRVDRMFNYQAQLTDLVSRHPDMDKKKVLDHALKTNQPDLEKVYREVYFDDILESEIQKRLKEELSKQRTDGISTGAKPLILKAREKPMSYEEATEAIMRERVRDGKS